MKKRKEPLPFVTKFMLSVWAVFLLFIFTGVISVFCSFVPSQGLREFCSYPLPIIAFLAMMFPLVWNTIFPSDRIKFPPWTWKTWLGMVLGLTFFALGFSLMFLLSWGIPTKYFASKRVEIPVTVAYTAGFFTTYDYNTWIGFRHDGSTRRFMWYRDDPVMNGLHRGDCIELHAREWPLGFYVDSISRSDACHHVNADLHEEASPTALSSLVAKSFTYRYQNHSRLIPR